MIYLNLFLVAWGKRRKAFRGRKQKGSTWEKCQQFSSDSLPSSAQTGQHSSWGMTGLAQSLVSSQMTSSHITWPLSHTQIWHGSGFHTSRSANTWPSRVQLEPVPEGAPEGNTERGVRGADETPLTGENTHTDTLTFEPNECVWKGAFKWSKHQQDRDFWIKIKSDFKDTNEHISRI